MERDREPCFTSHSIQKQTEKRMERDREPCFKSHSIQKQTEKCMEREREPCFKSHSIQKQTEKCMEREREPCFKSHSIQKQTETSNYIIYNNEFNTKNGFHAYKHHFLNRPKYRIATLKNGVAFEKQVMDTTYISAWKTYEMITGSADMNVLISSKSEDGQNDLNYVSRINSIKFHCNKAK